MCAEQYYRSCHRQIISDYLKVQGRGLIHIIGKGKTEEHELTSFSKVADEELTYPKSRRHSASAQFAYMFFVSFLG